MWVVGESLHAPQQICHRKKKERTTDWENKTKTNLKKENKSKCLCWYLLLQVTAGVIACAGGKRGKSQSISLMFPFFSHDGSWTHAPPVVVTSESNASSLFLWPRNFQHCSQVHFVIWHRHLGHPSDSVLSKINSVSISKSLECEICHFSKSSKFSFNNSTTRVTHAFELIHLNAWGPFDTSLDGYKYFVTLLDGYKYFVTFIDDLSRVTWVYLLKFKSDVFSCFQDFHTLITN